MHYIVMEITLLIIENHEIVFLNFCGNPGYSDSFSILGIWALGLAGSHINESNCKLMSPEHYF